MNSVCMLLNADWLFIYDKEFFEAKTLVHDTVKLASEFWRMCFVSIILYIIFHILFILNNVWELMTYFTFIVLLSRAIIYFEFYILFIWPC